MPLDVRRTAMIAGAAAAADYLVGSQLVAAIPSSVTAGADENMKSALRTAVCVAAADLLMQNL